MAFSWLGCVNIGLMSVTDVCLVEDIDNGGSHGYVRQSTPSQFCFEPKTALKM